MSIGPFTQLMTLTDDGEGRYGAVVDPMWTIGPKVHGGSMMAVIASAGRQAALAAGADPAMQPMAVAAEYLSAPDPGEMNLETELRKKGKQVCFVDVTLAQGNRTAVRAAVTLGVPDSGEPVFATGHSVDRLPAQPPESAHDVSEHPIGKIIHLGQGAEVRMDDASAHFLSGRSGEPEVNLWVRPHEADLADADTRALFAVFAGDVSAPVTLNRGLMGWAPTVQLTTYLRRMPAPGWLRVQARSTVLGNTWFEEDHTILDETGAVVAQSRQLAMMPR
jgi:acyl-coenzyme A thioesterase PaaI-like protein